MQDEQLKAYKVGDTDIVAAYDPAGAIKVLCEFNSYAGDEFTTDDVELVPDSQLDVAITDEDGNQCPTLRAELESATEPRYILGWE